MGARASSQRWLLFWVLHGLTVPITSLDAYDAIFAADCYRAKFSGFGFFGPTNITPMPLLGIQPAGLLQTMFESIGAAVAVVNHHCTVVFANQTALDMFAVDRKDRPVSFPDWRQNWPQAPATKAAQACS